MTQESLQVSTERPDGAEEGLDPFRTERWAANRKERMPSTATLDGRVEGAKVKRQSCPRERQRLDLLHRGTTRPEGDCVVAMTDFAPRASSGACRHSL